MLEQTLSWFLTTHSQILRKTKKQGFETLILMSLTHLFVYLFFIYSNGIEYEIRCRIKFSKI